MDAGARHERQPSEPSPGAAIRILTFNVKMLPGVVGGGRADEARARRIVAEVLATTPAYDVVCFQEVFDEDIRALFAAGLAAALPHQVTKCSDRGILDEDSGLFVAARFPVRSRSFREFVAKEAFTTDAFVDKGVVCVRLELDDVCPGVSLCLFNTHLQSTAAHHATRASQTAEIRAFAADALDRSRLQTTCAVLAGDFNIVGDASHEYREMMSRLGGPRDLFREAHPDVATHPGFTWDGADNCHMIPAYDTGKQRIDYLFALDAVPALDAAPPRPLRRMTLAASSVVRFGRGPDDRLSDHFGVMATLLLPPGASDGA